MGLYWKLQDIKDLYLEMYRVILKCVQMTVSNFFQVAAKDLPSVNFFFLNSMRDPAFPSNYFMFSQT